MKLIFLNNTDCGVVVKQGDEQGLAAELMRLAGEPAICESMGRNGRNLFDGALSQASSLAGWEDVLKNADTLLK